MRAIEPPTSCKVYTPKLLAKAMVEAIADGFNQRWLEPSCGTGSFIEALRQLGVTRNKIVGVDLDRQEANADRLANVTRGNDFLAWSETRKGKFDCVVGNPPYLAIRTLPTSLKNVASSIRDLDGHPVGDRSNTWYPFLVRSVEMLRNGGNLAFILPAASEYADYASAGRRKLTQMFDRVDVIRSRRPLFDGVSEGVVILLATDKGGNGKLFRRHEVEDVQGAVRRLGSIGRTKARNCPSGMIFKSPQVVRFSDVADIRIGAVTGDAGYFILSENQRQQFDLPEQCLQPIVSRSKQIRRASHDFRTWQMRSLSGEKVWLFRPGEKDLENLAVQSYLDLAEEDGGCHRNRFKIRNREPWYVTPLRGHPDFFLTGMSGLGLWLCMNECPDLNATNTLYTGTFREGLNRRQKYAWALTLLTSQVQKQIVRSKRIYADGLSKLEPGQVNALELPVPPRIQNAVTLYRKAVKAFIAGNQREAAFIADSVVHKRSPSDKSESRVNV